MKKSVCFAIGVTVLAGCSTIEPGAAPDRLLFNKIVVTNDGSRDIANLQIAVSRINGVFSCSRLLSNSFCSNTFPIREYQGNSVTLTWEEGGVEFTAGPFVAEPPVNRQGELYSIKLVIQSGGSYSVDFIEQ